MALTVTKIRQHNIGDQFLHIYTVAFDNSYATGGLSLTAAQLGFQLAASSGGVKTWSVFAVPQQGYTCPYDYTAKKLQAWSGGTEVSGATDLSSILTAVEVHAISRYKA